MKPHRIKMTHALILHYGLYNDLEVICLLCVWLSSVAIMCFPDDCRTSEDHARWCITCVLLLQCFRPRPAEKKDLLKFHSSDYLSFLQTVTTENQVHTSEHK